MTNTPRAAPPHRLSSPDRDRLQRLEAIVEEGLTTFIRVGNALREIRDRRLYRETHDSFNAYCQDRWGIGRHYAYRQIRASAVVALLHDVDSCQQPGRVPANEAQARPLTKLEPEEARQAWSLAVDLVEGAQPTSADVQKAVDLVTEPGDEEDPGNPGASVHFSSQNDEWLSPPRIVERVEEVLGEIALDPCASSRSSPAVPAETHLTREEDGLSRSWSGTVYMNPPYGRAIERWVDKLVQEYEQGSVSEAATLLPARTDTAWFRRLRPYPKCFLHGRLTFSDHENSAPFPSMTVYLGPEPETFVSVFSELGDVYVAINGG